MSSGVRLPVVNHCERLRPFRALPDGLIQASVDRDWIGGSETFISFHWGELGQIDLPNPCPTTELGPRRRGLFRPAPSWEISSKAMAASAGLSSFSNVFSSTESAVYQMVQPPSTTNDCPV